MWRTQMLSSCPLSLLSSCIAAAALQAYLDDFEKFCSKLGGATAEVMGDLLAFEVRASTLPVLKCCSHVL